MKRSNFTGMKYGRGKAMVAVTIVATGLALMTGLMPQIAWAQGSVRSWGMGGTGVATARGLDAPNYNPANLAFSDGFSVGLAAAAVDIHNNALSLDRYNEITGSYLDTAAKEQLLNDIPDSGFKLDGNVNASVLGLQAGSFALTFNAVGAGSGNLDKDYFDLVLFGNQLGETVDFSNTNGEGYALGSAGISYGGVLSTGERSRLSYGFSAKYLHGLYEMHIEEASGELHTGTEEISGEAYVSTISSEGGQGYGLDFGLALQAPKGWTLGLSMENLYTNIDWNRNVQANDYRVNAADINALNEDLGEAVANSDTSYAAEGYSTTLPRQLRFGAANRFGSFDVAFDYVQGFENRGITSTTPHFHVGTEWWITGIVQPRFGLSVGGVAGTGASAGLGLKLGFWRVDLAAVSRGGLDPNKTKGVAFAMGSSLEF
ncbi:MAG: conjugal transfer protein TraF [bacterium]|nr:conjugal transfer protein TraF [bacterium]